jgi:hypothetical protein
LKIVPYRLRKLKRFVLFLSGEFTKQDKLELKGKYEHLLRAMM